MNTFVLLMWLTLIGVEYPVTSGIPPRTTSALLPVTGS